MVFFKKKKKAEVPRECFYASYKNSTFTLFLVAWKLHRRENLDEFSEDLKNQDNCR
jgi:hypothetical protein